MKKTMMVLLISMMVMGAAAQGKDPTPKARVAKSFAKITSEVQAILTEKRIHSLFDNYRQMSAYGVTYQPSLVAPNDLVARLNKEQLRQYSGIKLFDTIYAATFLKRQEVADGIKAIEEIQTAVDLRSHADINNSLLETLKKAAGDPESIDVQKLIEQLSKDYVSELPALISNPESADYLIDSLYGFLIQMSYVVDELDHHDKSGDVLKALHEVSNTDTHHLILELFQAFDRMDDDIRVGSEVAKKMEVFQQMDELEAGNEVGMLTDEQAQPMWQEIAAKVAAIRASILTPVE